MPALYGAMIPQIETKLQSLAGQPPYVVSPHKRCYNTAAQTGAHGRRSGRRREIVKSLWRRHLTALVGTGLFLGGLALYLSTMAPSVVMGDPGEYQLVPYVLGIAHPPGYGFYTLLGKLFATLVPAGRIAFRMNLLSGVCGATLVTLAYLQTLHLTGQPAGSARAQLPAVLGAASLAAGASFMQHASYANAHIVTVTLAMVSLLLLLRWWRAGGDRWLYAFFFVAGLSPTQHPLLVFAFPAYALFILAVRPRILRQFRKLLTMAGCALLGLTVYLYYPLRSATGPPFGPSNAHTWDGFLHLVLARGLTVNVFPFTVQEQLYRLGDVARLMRLQFALPTLVLALAGVVWLAARRPRALLLLGGYAAITVYITVNILQDAMAYLLGPTVVVGVLIGAGGLALAEGIIRWRAKPVLRRGAAALGMLLFVFPVMTAAHNQPRANLSDYRQADAFVDAVFEQFGGQGRGARLLCAWEQMTPLHYYRLVEGRAPDPADVEIVAVSAGRTAPWAKAARANVGAGPLYAADYRAEIARAGFRLQREGHFYRVLPGPRPEDDPPPIGHQFGVSLDGGALTLLGYDLDRAHLRAGESLRLTVYARLNEDTDEIYLPFLQLGDAGQLRFTTDSKFLSRDWSPGEIVVQDYDVPLLRTTAPGTYSLRLGVRAMLRGTDLPLTAAGETTLPLERVQLDAPRFPPPGEAMSSALGNFGDRMLLTGAVVRIGGRVSHAPWDVPLTVHAGDSVRVTLGWRCLRRMDDSYKVFVQLVGPGLFNPRTGGPLWGQDDFWPVGGAFPTHLWIPRWVEGQRVTDAHAFEVDPAAPPGDYFVAVGVYDTVGQRRLGTLDAQGDVDGDWVVLGAVRVGE